VSSEVRFHAALQGEWRLASLPESDEMWVGAADGQQVPSVAVRSGRDDKEGRRVED